MLLLAAILAALTSAPIAYRDGPRVGVLAVQRETVHRYLHPAWRWEGLSTKLTVTRGDGVTTCEAWIDERGPWWCCGRVAFFDDGVVVAETWHTSDPGDVLSRCYGSWDDLAADRSDPCAASVVLMLRRCGAEPPAAPRVATGPAWVGRALTRVPCWRVREVGWRMLAPP